MYSWQFQLLNLRWKTFKFVFQRCFRKCWSQLYFHSIFLGIFLFNILPNHLFVHSGFQFIRNPFLPGAQRYWVKRCLADYPCKPNVTNLDTHYQKDQLTNPWQASRKNVRYYHILLNIFLILHQSSIDLSYVSILNVNVSVLMAMFFCFFVIFFYIVFLLSLFFTCGDT